MKKFLLIVIGTVAVGLTLRYTVVKPNKSTSKPKPTTQEPAKPEPRVESDPTKPAEPEKPVTPPEPEPPEPPPPPRIKGSVQISDTATQHFAVAPGIIYYCEAGSVMAQPKDGGPAKRVGDCDGAFDFIADAQGVFYCDDHQLKRITAGTDGSHVVADNVECIMEALDTKYAYFAVPGFEGIPNPGVYRVARAGGVPERIHATRPKEQFMVVAEDDVLWIGAWAAGTIAKLAKTPHAKAKTVVTGQKGIVNVATDATHLYWYSENTTEVRRRKKTGGPIEVIGRDIVQEPVLVVDGHAYWFEGGEGKDTRLMHMVPGAAKAEQLAEGLRVPSMRADSEGVYVSELDREGIFMFKR